MKKLIKLLVGIGFFSLISLCYADTYKTLEIDNLQINNLTLVDVHDGNLQIPFPVQQFLTYPGIVQWSTIWEGNNMVDVKLKCVEPEVQFTGTIEILFNVEKGMNEVKGMCISRSPNGVIAPQWDGTPDGIVSIVQENVSH